MAIQIIGAMLAAFCITRLFGKRLIPWLEKHGFRQHSPSGSSDDRRPCTTGMNQIHGMSPGLYIIFVQLLSVCSRTSCLSFAR